MLTWPNEGGARGKIVIDVGDILLPQKLYVRSAIELTVENSYATRIDGGVDAELLREYVASFRIRKPTRFRTSAGVCSRARWTTLGLYDREATIGMDARAYEGNFLFSLGPNNEAGGSRYHLPHRHPAARLHRAAGRRGRGAPGQGAGWRRPED